MIVKTVVVGMLNTNCYVLEKGDECLIIDPGNNFDKIKENINKKVVGVLLTHRHFDHIGALDDVLNNYNVSVFDRNNLKEGTNDLNSFKFEVKYNPGHTMDSISFIFDDIMFTGDFVFEGCIGRCDLGGDFYLMQNSIKDLLKLKKDFKILPGHGNSTTLNNERSMLESYIK